jgi:hypothetical protein
LMSGTQSCRWDAYLDNTEPHRPRILRYASRLIHP